MTFKLLFIITLLLLLLTKTMSKKRILGGQVVEFGDFPMMAQILQSSDGSHVCGGAIITHQIVITAAECFQTNRELTIQNRKVMVGDIHRQETETSPVSRQIIPIEDLSVPEGYYQNKIDYNIAVVQLKSSIKFSENVEAISLARVRPVIGSQCSVCGWGSTEENPNPTVLIEATISIQDPSVCENSLEKFNKNAMVCAGDETKQNGTCHGDKGGPLICGGRVTGLVNYGKLLCYGMTAFVDVAQFSNWIIEKSIISEETHLVDKNGSSRIIFNFIVLLFSFKLVHFFNF